MKINALVIIFLGMLLTAGCTPLVRYTHDHSAGRSGNRSSGGGADQRKAVDGVEDSLQSGWESSEGGADRRQSDWLASELGSADQGQPGGGRRESAAKGAAPQEKRLEQVVSSYLGVPYKYGGTTRSGMDCSGFVSAVYREAYGIQLKRTSSAMWKDGTPVSIVTARPGDLVFFKGGAFGTIDHVGIYMGRTRFVHASSKSGVVFANLKETYYARRFAGFRRMD